jgi:hypothetical protein
MHNDRNSTVYHFKFIFTHHWLHVRMDATDKNALSLLKPLNQQHLNRTLVPRRCHGGTSQRIA